MRSNDWDSKSSGAFILVEPSIPQAVLFEQLRGAIGSRRVKAAGSSRILLHCTSPVGSFSEDDERFAVINSCHQALGYGKLCVFEHDKRDCFLTVEASILFGVETTQPNEVFELLEGTTHSADALEREVLGTDEALDSVRSRLVEEHENG